jgi:hypothetical protein
MYAAGGRRDVYITLAAQSALSLLSCYQLSLIPREQSSGASLITVFVAAILVV